MKFDNHHPTNEFLDPVSSNLFILHIKQAARIRDSSKTLIDNVFSNDLIENTISGNVTATISVHLPKFITIWNKICLY